MCALNKSASKRSRNEIDIVEIIFEQKKAAEQLNHVLCFQLLSSRSKMIMKTSQHSYTITLNLNPHQKCNSLQQYVKVKLVNDWNNASGDIHLWKWSVSCNARIYVWLLRDHLSILLCDVVTRTMQSSGCPLPDAKELLQQTRWPHYVRYIDFDEQTNQ